MAARHPAKVAWDAANAERKRAATAAWWAAHPEYKKQWRRENRHLEMAQRGRGKDRKAVSSAMYAVTHRDQRAATEQRRRAKKRNAGGNGVSTAQWAAIREEYGYLCAYCALPSPLVMEHVVPLSRGGLHDVGNVVPACQKCNSSKHDKQFIVWLATAHRRV